MSDWAEVKENRQVGEGVFLLRLASPAIASAARPGQFVMLRVSHGLDPLLPRPFSIHGVRGDEMLILYRVVGKGTRMLSLVRPGFKTLSLWGPLGRGFDLTPERPMLVAGGMGVAPLAFAAEALAERERRVVFIYGAANRAALLGGTEMGWRGQHPGAIELTVCTDDGSFGLRGLVTVPLVQRLADTDGVLACGPLPMLKAVAALCAQGGVACQVSLEAPMACGLGACLGCAIPAAAGGYVRACQEGPVMDASLVDWERV